MYVQTNTTFSATWEGREILKGQLTITTERVGALSLKNCRVLKISLRTVGICNSK